jgi:hypothetical protein
VIVPRAQCQLLDRLIVDAYIRRPPEDIWGEQAAKLLIAAEPW